MCFMWMGEHETARCASHKRTGSDLKIMLLGLKLHVSEDNPILFSLYSEDIEAHIDCTLEALTGTLPREAQFSIRLVV
jgi:hypothetical protein